MDYEYVAQTLAALSSLPVRLYQKEVFIKLFHFGKFKPDLAILEEKNIFLSKETVSYYMTDTFLMYGLFRTLHDDVQLVIGPVPLIPINHQMIIKILLAIGEPLTREKELTAYFQTIPSYPLRNFLQILCSFDYFINNKKQSIEDLIIKDCDAEIDDSELLTNINEQTSVNAHDLYEYEKVMLSLIEHGQTAKLQEMFAAPQSGRGGTIAKDALRQSQNLLICTATLVCRAAIKGGLNQEIAFSLSDIYIQKSELLTKCEEVECLNYQMVIDFAKRVENENLGILKHRLVRQVRDYILANLNNKITVEGIAKHLSLHRSYFTVQFKELTSLTPITYINIVKIDEAKRLLEISEMPISEMAELLGFASQSHFQKVFKEITGTTPKQFRDQKKQKPDDNHQVN